MVLTLINANQGYGSLNQNKLLIRDVIHFITLKEQHIFFPTKKAKASNLVATRFTSKHHEHDGLPAKTLNC
jgi:hypothetical protein